MLGGDVSVTSVPGEGSTFTITLPIGPADEQAAPDLDGGNAPITSTINGDDTATILVVDDDAVSRHIIGAHLIKEGYRTIYAESGLEALEVAREQKPDIITLDIMMPRLDGWSVLQALKADPDLKPIPVILVSDGGRSRPWLFPRRFGCSEQTRRPRAACRRHQRPQP